MTSCTDNQIKTSTRTDLVLRKLICQAPTNHSKWQGLAQLDTMLVRGEYLCHVVKN